MKEGIVMKVKYQMAGNILADHGISRGLRGVGSKGIIRLIPLRQNNLWQNLERTLRNLAVNTNDVNYSRLPVPLILEHFIVNSKLTVARKIRVWLGNNTELSRKIT